MLLTGRGFPNCLGYSQALPLAPLPLSSRIDLQQLTGLTDVFLPFSSHSACLPVSLPLAACLLADSDPWGPILDRPLSPVFIFMSHSLSMGLPASSYVAEGVEDL